MNLTPDISRKSLITLVFVHFSLSLFTIKKILANVLDQKGNVLLRASLIITVSYSQIVSLTLFRSISSPPPPEKHNITLVALINEDVFSLYVKAGACTEQDIITLDETST